MAAEPVLLFPSRRTFVKAVVAEVTDTPRLEKHWSVLWEGNRFGPSGRVWLRHAGSFRVSAFMDMDAAYERPMKAPAPGMAVCVANLQVGHRLSPASLTSTAAKAESANVLSEMCRYCRPNPMADVPQFCCRPVEGDAECR